MKLHHPSELKAKVIQRRREGESLNRLVTEFKLPKSTVQGWILNVPLSVDATRLIETRAREQRIKALSNRRIILPQHLYRSNFSPDLVRFFAHCLFDGSIFHDQAVYYSSHLGLAKEVALDGQRIFGLKPSWFLTKDKVYRVHFYSKNLVDFLRERKEMFLEAIIQMDLPRRREFLRAFFDDEGSVVFRPETSKRAVRGFQKDPQMLELIAQLLDKLEIDSRLENLNRAPEIVIRGRKNIEKFAQIINFSPHAMFRATRKNSYYKRPVKKRFVLQQLLKSYG